MTRLHEVALLEGNSKRLQHSLLPAICSWAVIEEMSIVNARTSSNACALDTVR